MGEKLSPAFLNRITAKAQKNAHASAKAEPIISFQLFSGITFVSMKSENCLSGAEGLGLCPAVQTGLQIPRKYTPG